MLIDTHAHLTDPRFDGEVDKIIQKAMDSTVEIIITSGSSLQTSQAAVKLAEKYANVYASVGVHPQDVADFSNDTIIQLKKLAQSKKVCAIGEIGLEYRDENPGREIQKEAFVMQLQLASQLNLPVVIHTRDAIGDTMQILTENKHLLTNGGTLHCFSESLEVAKQAIKLGLNISVGGVSTFTNARRLQEVLKEVPLESMMLETDCPWLAPTPYRGQRNEPSFVPLIAQNLANLKGVNVEQVAQITTQNARRLFKI